MFKFYLEDVCYAAVEDSKNVLISKFLILYRIAGLLLDFLSSSLRSISIYNYILILILKNLSVFSDFLGFLKKTTYGQFSLLSDIIAVDYPSFLNRFHMFYIFLSIKFNCRLFVFFNISENEFIPSCQCNFSSSGWLEREVWDLFGIFFSGNNDLRRILTDYGFKGHPLRKDFPTTGFVEIFYDDSVKSLVYVPVTLSQDFRFFFFSNPWKK